MGWPIMMDSLQELKSEIESSDLHYYNLCSSYGMNGWVLSESYEVKTIEV
ncbi:hypothetical protein [Isobaculum melis]|nr:hypothetical protein [Isobaculum melis]